MKARYVSRTKSVAPYILALLLTVCVITPTSANAGNDNIKLTLTPYVEGLTAPIFMTYDADGRHYVAERTGRVRIMEDWEVRAKPVLDIQDRVTTAHECGLLSMALAPDFLTSGDLYVSYSYDVQRLGDLVSPEIDGEPNDGCDSVIARFQVDLDKLVADPATEERILTLNQPYTNHNGGQITFGPDGYLYIALGDGGGSGDPHGLAQNGNSLLGKMLRIDISEDGGYTIPEDNPFIDNDAIRDEIWALGLRNPWRYSFDRQTGDLFIGDVGQSTLEEINFQAASSTGGENYGWNMLEGTLCYAADPPCVVEGTTPPILEYGRSIGSSVTGGYRYRGSETPALQGVYIYADYGSISLLAATEDDDGWENQIALRNSGVSYIAGLAEDANGELYLIALDGTIYRIDLANLTQRLFLPLLATN